MLTTPWTNGVTGPDRDCTVIAGRLPLQSFRDLPAVIAWAWRIRRHLAATPGLAGHATAVDISRPALWTVSAWTSRTDLGRFDGGELHRAAKSALRPRLWPATFVVWTCDPTDLPVAWSEVRRRIAAASQHR